MASDRIQRHVQRLLDEVDEAVSQLNWELVRERSRAVLALDPDDKDALSFMAAAERAAEPGAATVERPTQSSPLLTKPDQPSSFANGRYEVKRLLGEGGKKKVYLAQDTLLDREVAFALIKTEGLDEAGRTRITREAEAMGRLGDHPHIVTVYDLGVHEGQPFIVTTLMGGGAT